jgi:ribosomal protein L13E
MSEKAATKAPAKKAPAKKVSPKKRAHKAEKKEPAADAGPAVAEKAEVPSPLVLARHEGEMHQRDARGYSLGELESAEIAVFVAKRMKVPIDIRRRSVLESNVGLLKSWYVPAPRKAKAAAAEEPKAEKPAKKSAKKAKKQPKAKKE